VDLARAKPHVDFVFLKATDGKKKGGAMFVDRTFAPRWRRLADLAIPRGAYHYAKPNTSPADQAAHFIAVVQASGFQAGDVAILDMEDRRASKGLSPSALRKWVDRWVAEIRRILPIRDVVFYTGIPYWTGRMGDAPRLPAGCIGMIARYNRRGPYVRPPGRPQAWLDPPAI
jgi:GH25 family lysozyme M1 (1,4-beta-N-acetylmuramidase)